MRVAAAGICSPKGCQTIPGVVAPMRASHSVTYLFLLSGSGAQDRVREKGDSARAQARGELDQ